MWTKFGLAPIPLVTTLVAPQNQPSKSAWVGTWTLNVAKSKVHPPGYKDETITVPPIGSDTLTVKWTITGTHGDGTPINLTYDGKFDGRPYPLMSNGRQVGTATYQRLSSHRHTNHFDFSNGTTYADTLTMARRRELYGPPTRDRKPGRLRPDIRVRQVLVS